MKRLLISEREIVSRYVAGEKIKTLQLAAGVSRVAVYDVLKRNGIEVSRRLVLTLKCRFCGEKYEKPRSHVKGDNGGYCSIQCFHADRSIAGEYSKTGGCMARVNESLRDIEPATDRKLGKLCVDTLAAAGIFLKVGEVIHHKDFDRRNFAVDNLQVFKNQSEHMKFHHSLRNRKGK
jgi:hypothetical protein